MLHVETVLVSTLDLLKDLQSIPELADMRLVGGTALALQLGHRTSVDLDLFGSFDDDISFKQVIAGRGHSVEGDIEGAVQTLMVDGVKVDLVNYKYPWLAPAIEESGVRLAAPDDIMPMKLSAAANRGRKKDFIDIATLLESHALADMLALYQRKFSVTEISNALRGLTYFDDAESDPSPRMFSDLTWKDAKSRITSAVRDFIITT